MQEVACLVEGRKFGNLSFRLRKFEGLLPIDLGHMDGLIHYNNEKWARQAIPAISPTPPDPGTLNIQNTQHSDLDQPVQII